MVKRVKKGSRAMKVCVFLLALGILTPAFLAWGPRPAVAEKDPIRVAKFDGETVFIRNGGSQLEVGGQYAVMRGADRIATIEVVSVGEVFTKAEVVSLEGEATIRVGDQITDGRPGQTNGRKEKKADKWWQWVIGLGLLAFIIDQA